MNGDPTMTQDATRILGPAENSGRHSGKLAYTIPEFCAATGVGRTSVYEEIAAGRLKSIKAAGRRLILRHDGEAWLQACRAAA